LYKELQTASPRFEEVTAAVALINKSFKEALMLTRRRRRTTLIQWFCLFVIATALVAASVTNSSLAQQSPRVSETVIPLEGLDPVMLAQGKEVQGDMKFKVTRGKFEYIFASAESKAAFEKDPARYEIQLEGHCARMGAPTTGNPDLYAVHIGRIYIFGSEECQTLFKATPEKYLEVPAPAKAPATAEMIKRGQELIAKAVETLGGAKLDQLVSFQRKELRGNQIKNNLLIAFPDAVRQETIRPNFTLVSVVSPAESFFNFNNSTRAMTDGDRNFFQKELNHELLVLLRSRHHADFKAWAAGGDKSVERVEVELPGFTTVLGIDPATGRVLSQTYRGRGPGGAVGEIAINYSDFKTVEGVLLPFKIDATFDGQALPALSATVEAATINGQIDANSFKKPKS
jgi:YHS domain-containing protein